MTNITGDFPSTGRTASCPLWFPLKSWSEIMGRVEREISQMVKLWIGNDVVEITVTVEAVLSNLALSTNLREAGEKFREVETSYLLMTPLLRGCRRC
ncbi:hypothetical protein RRG08_038386 [Elysia crispata]|uniref:Uncharacterized protein n=1 Tax=Elysia crispata TaxID=231223 RepID=A0AAE1A9I6_9GAST|nr:hypothetical protein RRG08_038386 [Elysia crispata]